MVNEGGSWTEMQKAFNHWGLYPAKHSATWYTNTKDIINAGTPICMLLRSFSSGKEHAMTLRGYEEYSDGAKYYNVIDPNYSSGVSITVSGIGEEITYTIGGYKYYWYSACY